MSSKTSSRSTLTTVPSTMSPSLKYLMVSSIAARKASCDPMSLTATLGVGLACVLLVMWGLAPADKMLLGALNRQPPRLGPTGALDLPGRPDQPRRPNGQTRLCLAMADCTRTRRVVQNMRAAPTGQSEPSNRDPARRLVACFLPAAAGAEGHLQRHAELERAAHARGHQRAQVVQLTVRYLEDQLVVDLQQHPRARALLPQRPVHVQHRDLDDVCGGALDRRVESHALGHLPALPVVRGEIGQVPATAHDRLGVAVPPCPGDHLVQVVAHPAELLEVPVH